METKVVRSKSSWEWGFFSPFRTWVNGKLLIKRRQIIQTPWFTVLFTRILLPDTDRDPHNHARDFISIILTGGYTEVIYPDSDDLTVTRIRTHKRWSVHMLRTSEAHSITSIEKPLRTLLIGGRMKAERVFWTREGKINWEKYGR